MHHAPVASASALVPSSPLRPLARCIPGPGRRPLDLMRSIWSPANPLQIDKHERALLAALAVKMDNGSGDCGPIDLATLESMTGLSRATVERAAAGLIARRYVERRQRWRPDGGPAPSLYRVRLESFGAEGVTSGRDAPRLPERRSALPPDLPAFPNVREGAAPAARTQGERKVEGEGTPAIAPPARPAVEQRPQVTMTPEAEAILEALRAPALARVASPFLARRLAGLVAKDRPLALALQGLRELAEAAGDDAAEGRPWHVERLRRSCRTWIRGARNGHGRRPWGASGMPVDRAPVERPAPARVHATGGRAFLAALAPGWSPTELRRRPECFT